MYQQTLALWPIDACDEGP